MKINRSRFFILVVVFFNSLFAGCKITENYKVHPPEIVIKPPPQREKMEELVVPMIEDRKGTEKLITFSLRDADIRETMLSLSRTIGCNVTLDPDITGKATVDVKDVTLPEALDTILTPLNLQYRKENNVIRISKLTPETRFFKVNYIDVVRTGSSNLTTFLNVASGGGGGGAISSMSMSDVWKDLESGIKGLLSEKGILLINKSSGIVMVTDIPSNLKKVATYLEKIEGSIQRQVMIQARIVAVTLTKEFQMGIDWSKISSISGIKGEVSQSLSPSTGLFQIGLSEGDFSLLFDAMSTQGKVNILSSPRISTLNNQKAAIKVVKSDVFFEVQRELDKDARTTTTSTTSKIVDIGIILEVTPQISGDGQIIMDIHPIITEKAGEATFESEDINISTPIITVREANTVVKAQDGQTMVIAGLIQEKADVQKRKVPFLGDIPGLGVLFGQTKNSSEKNELVIFLTPTILAGKNIDELTQEELKNFDLKGI
ncbi:MAG: secretin and TonB N-terminal domain-containing protein [Candidatus Brocadiales bacterium]|nr:secretin and TonB N-terminal domain-containing protein [Candidatus Brocadiales bacterium]